MSHEAHGCRWEVLDLDSIAELLDVAVVIDKAASMW